MQKDARFKNYISPNQVQARVAKAGLNPVYAEWKENFSTLVNQAYKDGLEGVPLNILDLVTGTGFEAAYELVKVNMDFLVNNAFKEGQRASLVG